MAESADPALIRATADALVQRTAEALREQLREVAEAIDPFPPFPGAVFAYGIEVEPPGTPDPDIGCVILGNDGALYELEIGLDPTRTTGDDAGERREELRPLEVPPVAFIRYAHAALEAAAGYLESQR